MNEEALNTFESYNARHLTPKQIAKTFIPPKHFDDLIKGSHSLVVGPRGSGKTTLLKMLQPEALSIWEHPNADFYRKKINYTGVFIPTDIAWRSQLNSLNRSNDDGYSGDVLSYAAFTTHVLSAVIETMCFRCFQSDANVGAVKKISLSSKKEAEFSERFSDLCQIQIKIPSFEYIKHSLMLRLRDIFSISKMISGFDRKDAIQTLAENKYLFMNCVSLTSSVISAFDSTAGEGDARWALLFDELEIAPKKITQELLQCLRSTDQKLLFKLSMSPYSEEMSVIDDPAGGMVGQDYTAIPLWFSDREQSIRFSRELANKILSENGISDANIDRCLGREPIGVDVKFDKNKAPYEKGSIHHSMIKMLIDTDASFLSYIQKNKLDVDQIDKMPNQKRAQHFRKIMPIVRHRLVFRRELGLLGKNGLRVERGGSRSRKNPAIYAGADVLLSFCEGNPRWLIGIVSSLISEMDRPNNRVNPAKQSEHIMRATNRFRALLKTISCKIDEDGTTRGLLSLLDRIGENIYQGIVVDPFSPDPYGSFIIDANAKEEVVLALQQALNAGGIVYEPDDGSAVLGSLRGKRFRLSYLLSPHYKIPLVKLRAAALSRLLGKSFHSSQRVIFDGAQ